MHVPRLLSAVLVILSVCACDSRKEFTGSYAVSGELSLQQGTRKETSQLEDVQLTIVADAFDSDRLYLDFDCGLSATPKDEQSFTVDYKRCPSYTQDSCSYLWTFEDGGGSLPNASSIDFRPFGTISMLCSDGYSGMLNFSFRLTGVRKSGAEPDLVPPGSQDLRSRQWTPFREQVTKAIHAQFH